MPNIKPVSDLRSYSAVLDDVRQGSPVFLTRNGRGRYVILDMADYQRYEDERTLLSQLDHGVRAAEEGGSLSTSQVRAAFAGRFGTSE